jgi:hypothetical protein
LRSKLLARSVWILIQHGLNVVVVRLKQRPHLLLLFRSQLEIFRKAGKFLVDRLGRMNTLKLVTLGGLCPTVLSCAKTSHAHYEHSSIGKRERLISH